jgi:CRISPR/Cas system-associated exonuclease Cas4 (RecB family)
MDIETLVDDIYKVVEGNGGWNETTTEYLRDSISTVASERFSGEEHPRDTLSLSGIGKPCERELWYRVNESDKAEPLGPETKGTFFYGDLLESLVISLAKAAGHDVQGEQDVLYACGIKGHRDCVIDGMTVDVKSASSYSFQKFADNSLRGNDPFGYISQLSSYVYAGQDDPLVVNKTEGAFLVIKKDRFKLCLDRYDFTEELQRKEQEIESKKSMVLGDIPPRMPTVPQSKTSPNTKLDTICSYCSFRTHCWPEARTFIYSNGPTYLVDVKKIPNVPEVKPIW